MSELVVETPEGVALRHDIAGAGTRLIAALIDGLAWSFSMLALVVLMLTLGLSPMIASAFGIVSLVAYSFLFSWRWNGRTPGKALLGLRTCDQQGFPARAGQHFLRALFLPLEMSIAVGLPLTWLLIAATPHHQRLGDLVAGTLVLREHRRKRTLEPASGVRWSGLAARTLAPSSARVLDGRDLGFLRHLLTRADLEPSARARLLVGAARHYARRLDLGERAFRPAEARTFLRELFLLLREARERGPGALSAAPPAVAAAAPGSAPDAAASPR